VLGVLLVLVLICGGTCAGCVYLGGQAAKQAGQSIETMSITNIALASVLSDATVTEKLGAGVTITGLPKREGPLDYANTVVMFDIAGPKGVGTVTAHAKQVTGSWQITALKVQFSDGSTADLQAPETTAPQLNF